MGSYTSQLNYSIRYNNISKRSSITSGGQTTCNNDQANGTSNHANANKNAKCKFIDLVEEGKIDRKKVCNIKKSMVFFEILVWPCTNRPKDGKNNFKSNSSSWETTGENDQQTSQVESINRSAEVIQTRKSPLHQTILGKSQPNANRFGCANASEIK